MLDGFARFEEVFARLLQFSSWMVRIPVTRGRDGERTEWGDVAEDRGAEARRRVVAEDGNGEGRHFGQVEVRLRERLGIKWRFALREGVYGGKATGDSENLFPEDGTGNDIIMPRNQIAGSV